MVFDFDLRLFCENLKATKPPYECPAPGCGRVYKTYIGIQFHLFNYDHENPDNKSSSTAGNSDRPNQQGASKKAHHRHVCDLSSASHVSQEEPEHEVSSSGLSPHNVSVKSQRVMEVTLGGRVHHIDVYEPMNVLVRQSHAPASIESVDNKSSELVACTTKTISDELLPSAPVISDTVPVAELTDSLTAKAAVSNDLLETGSKDHIADLPVESVTDVASDAGKAESSYADEGCINVEIKEANKHCSDVEIEDVNKAAITTCLAVTSSIPTSECLPPDSYIINTSNTSSMPSESDMHTALAVEVKSEIEHEVSIKPSTECVQKNTCSDDTSVPLSSTELVKDGNSISTTCAKSESVECDTVKSCDTVSTSTVVTSKSAPTKLSLPSAEFKILKDYVRPPKIAATAQRPEYYKFSERTADELDAVVEYDMDEEVNIAEITILLICYLLEHSLLLSVV